MTEDLTSVAIIGTAGRDKDRKYDIDLWCAMWEDVQKRFDKGKRYRLISGGAAWADHLAVELFLSDPGRRFELMLYLPCYFNNRSNEFKGEDGDRSAGACNFYHEKFMTQTGIDGRRQISEAFDKGARFSYENAQGFNGMFARNKKVALDCDAVLAYTWGPGKEPTDGGTKNTWDQVKGRKVHVPLEKILNTEK